MNKPQRLRLVGFVSVLAMTLVACGGDDAAPEAEAELEGGLDEVCAQEGSFTYWATFEDENWRQLEAAFTEAHPGIDIEFLPLRGEDQLQRILTAASAGQDIGPDAVSSGLDEIVAPLAARDLLDTDVDWESVGIPENTIQEETNAVRVSRTAIGLAYNTDTTSPDDLPDTWEELLDEQYAGEFVIDPRGRPFEKLGLAWGEEQALDYVQRLVELDPLVIEGGTAGMTAVLAGEALMATGGRSDSARELQADGAPIDIKYLDIIPTEEDYNALLADADNRNPAMCFIGWLSTEGVEVYQEVEFKTNEDVPPAAPEGAELVSVETAERSATAAEYGEQIIGIIEGGG